MPAMSWKSRSFSLPNVQALAKKHLAEQDKDDSFQKSHLSTTAMDPGTSTGEEGAKRPASIGAKLQEKYKALRSRISATRIDFRDECDTKSQCSRELSPLKSLAIDRQNEYSAVCPHSHSEIDSSVLLSDDQSYLGRGSVLTDSSHILNENEVLGCLNGSTNAYIYDGIEGTSRDNATLSAKTVGETWQHSNPFQSTPNIGRTSSDSKIEKGKSPGNIHLKKSALCEHKSGPQPWEKLSFITYPEEMSRY